MRRLPKGKLIVLEGIDGAGKTTQCDRLESWLRGDGWDVERLREPTDGPWGRKIRELAREGLIETSAREMADLFIKDRTDDVRQNIAPALERGALCLLDRYYYSSIAYQGAHGLEPAIIRRDNEAIAPPADLLLYLDLPPDRAVERIEGGRGQSRDLFEREDYLHRVHEIFAEMHDPQMVRIDATQSPEAVWADIQDTTNQHLAGWTGK